MNDILFFPFISSIASYLKHDDYSRDNRKDSPLFLHALDSYVYIAIVVKDKHLYRRVLPYTCSEKGVPLSYIFYYSIEYKIVEILA